MNHCIYYRALYSLIWRISFNFTFHKHLQKIKFLKKYLYYFHWICFRVVETKPSVVPRRLHNNPFHRRQPTRMNCFRYLKLMSRLNAAICTTTYLERQKCYGPSKKILFKKQLFDLEVKVPQRSLWYATHRLMVTHPHTKYHWPISKDKNVMAWTRKYYLKNNYLTLRSKVITVCTHIPNKY